MASSWKIAWAAALKAKRTWEKLPKEQRQKLLDGAKRTATKQGPVVARKATETARRHGPIIAERTASTALRAAETARAQVPVIAKRLAEALERARANRNR